MPHWAVVMRGWLACLAVVAITGLPATGSPAAMAANPPQVPEAPKSKIVYLTFDDGPNAINSPRLLSLLAKEHVPATFFLVGQFLAADPVHASRLWLAGHTVGNHTWSHADLTQLTGPQIAHQLRSTQRLMGRAGGRCMRPPYGATNTNVSAVAAGLGLTTVMWTVDPQDWAHQNAAYISGHVLSQVRNKSVVLMHDGGGPRPATIAAVRTLIPALRLQGYEFRTVPSCRVPLGGTLFNAAQKKPRPRPDPPSPEPSASPVVPAPDASASAPGAGWDDGHLAASVPVPAGMAR